MKSAKFIRPHFLLLLFVYGCSSHEKYSLSIKDFDENLQPVLVKIVATGGLIYTDSALQFLYRNITNDQLTRLSNAEQPLLRVVAFNEMLRRPEFDHFGIIMNNLDDTANVVTDNGEFGIWFGTVSDYILDNGRWRDSIAKNKTIDEVITRHNYLRAAYKILPRLLPQERYYPFIKAMVERQRATDELIDALYALAKFRYTTDIPFIKNYLLQNTANLNETAFELMKEYQDTSYFAVFKKYYPKYFYSTLQKDGIAGIPIAFLSTVASYKNEGSRAILTAILHRTNFSPYLIDTSYMKVRLKEVIWSNACPAYQSLINEIAAFMKIQESLPSIPLDSGESIFPPDRKEPIRGWVR